MPLYKNQRMALSDGESAKMTQVLEEFRATLSKEVAKILDKTPHHLWDATLNSLQVRVMTVGSIYTCGYEDHLKIKLAKEVPW